MFFKEVYEFFGIFGELFTFLFKLVLFLLLLSSPVWLSLYLGAKLEVEPVSVLAAFLGIVAVLALGWCCKIAADPNLTREQKWALMNGREMPPSIKVKSEEQIYKDLFDEAERNLKWKESKEQCKSAQYELDKDGTKYVRIK